MVIPHPQCSNKVFTALHCFMPSKQMRAFSWAFNVAARHLLTDDVLELNSCLACDGESAMFGPLRSMMRNKSGCFAFSKNRLDKFHLFEKEWKDNVICKVGRHAAIVGKKYTISYRRSRSSCGIIVGG